MGFFRAYLGLSEKKRGLIRKKWETLCGQNTSFMGRIRGAGGLRSHLWQRWMPIREDQEGCEAGKCGCCVQKEKCGQAVHGGADCGQQESQHPRKKLQAVGWGREVESKDD